MTLQRPTSELESRPRFIDLFCGCGGFSLGLERAGFRCEAAIDFNAQAINVFKANFPNVPLVLERDLTTFEPANLATMMAGCDVDLIVGGPPCQGFSTVRQVDGANHGPRIVSDARRYLYQAFLRYVEFFRPRVFVMENVLGIRSASGGDYFRRVQQEARAIGYRVHEQAENCHALGVPQKRKRQLFIGTRGDQIQYFHPHLKRVARSTRNPTLGEAIGDLPALSAGEGSEITGYDLSLRQKHIQEYGPAFLDKVLEVQRAESLSAHRARPHSQRDLRDFRRLREGESSAEALRRAVDFEFPYSKESFKDRYTRQSRFEPCSTIVAHLSKDGLMFVHPTQDRSLTPREAARIQTFPDWFVLPVARTHQFRLIGNAVPPIVGEAIGEAVIRYFARNVEWNMTFYPDLVKNRQEKALDDLRPLLDLSPQELRAVPDMDLRVAWHAISVLFWLLHPESTKCHGSEVLNDHQITARLVELEPRLAGPRYAQSGWPLKLAPIGDEARRRYENGIWTCSAFYDMTT